MLTFSRKLESKRQTVDLNYTVAQVEKLLERTIPKMIELELQLAEDLKAVNADHVQVEQLLMNLAVNAKDAMPEGGKLVIATENITLEKEFWNTHLRVVPGDYVLLTVSDTGEGISKEAMDHIFEPFFTTKDVGNGTVFKIYLPTSERVESSTEAESQNTRHDQTATILLVDDDESIRDLGRETLGEFGYTVLTAANGEEAIELYRDRKEGIDLVVLDVIMPGMGGSKCLEALLEYDPQAKVVVSSGYSSNSQKNNLIKKGALTYLSKPYLTNELLSVVREVLAEYGDLGAVSAMQDSASLGVDGTYGCSSPHPY